MSAPSRPLVFLATPCFGGLVTQNYMLSVIRLMQHSATAGFDTALALLGHDSLITRSRNTLVAQFLDNRAATHLMFIDADIGFEPAQIERMLRFDEDVVAGMYPLKVIDWHPTALDRVRQGEPVQTAPLLYVGRLAEGAEAERRGALRGRNLCRHRVPADPPRGDRADDRGLSGDAVRGGPDASAAAQRRAPTSMRCSTA